MGDKKKRQREKSKLTVKPERLEKQMICDGLYAGDCTRDLKPVPAFNESDLNEIFEDANDENVD